MQVNNKWKDLYVNLVVDILELIIHNFSIHCQQVRAQNVVSPPKSILQGSSVKTMFQQRKAVTLPPILPEDDTGMFINGKLQKMHDYNLYSQRSLLVVVYSLHNFFHIFSSYVVFSINICFSKYIVKKNPTKQLTFCFTLVNDIAILNDEAEKYWHGDHHRFSYTENMGPLLEVSINFLMCL